jgi:hypothetical protein
MVSSIGTKALAERVKPNRLSARGHSRCSDRAPFTSGLPRLADILGRRWHVSNVP